jgi:predicted aspartyl protease
MQKKAKQSEYNKLFDTGNKGYLTVEEEQVYLMISNKYKFSTDDILGMDITEENLNKLVCKFNLKFSRKEVKEIVDFINLDSCRNGK